MTTSLAPLTPLPKPWLPHAFQKKAIKFLLEHAAGALFLDPGMGKTAITLASFKILKQQRLAKKMLVLAPLRACYSVWPNEIKKWADFNGLTYQILHGPHKDEALAKQADIYITNFEGLEWLLQLEKIQLPNGKTRVKVDLRRFRRFGFEILTVDELSKLKHTNTSRFKALKWVLSLFSRRWGLTGSPAANGLMGLFGQCYVLDQGRTLGQYITNYRLKYFIPSYDGFSWDLRKGADKEIFERLKPLALRMAAEDYLDLPQLVVNNIEVELPAKVRKIYDQLETHLLAKIDDKTVVASNAGVASMKCRQVAAGGVYLDQELLGLVRLPKSEREWVNLHMEKADALAELIEELQGEPLLVAYDFEHDLDRLRQRLGKDVPYIGGGVSPKRAKELEELWNRGKLPVLLGHPQSIGHSLNLQEVGHHVCWHSMTFDFELYDQFIKRVLRQGNRHKKVFVHHLMAKDTVDLQMLLALQSKDRGQQALFNALKQIRRTAK